MASVSLPYDLVGLIFELGKSPYSVQPHPRLAGGAYLVRIHTSTDIFLIFVSGLYAKVSLSIYADETMFGGCRIARDDDAFITSAVQQLAISPGSTLLSLCTGMAHLAVHQCRGVETLLPRLDHLKYLAFDF